MATTLTSLTCFLAQNPDKLGRVVSEIRQAFDTYDSIKAQEAQRLPYLQAVISEGLRLFPPASGGAPRVSPGFELHGAFIPKGVGCHSHLACPRSTTKRKSLKDGSECQPMGCDSRREILPRSLFVSPRTLDGPQVDGPQGSEPTVPAWAARLPWSKVRTKPFL